MNLLSSEQQEKIEILRRGIEDLRGVAGCTVLADPMGAPEEIDVLVSAYRPEKHLAQLTVNPGFVLVNLAFKFVQHAVNGSVHVGAPFFPSEKKPAHLQGNLDYLYFPFGPQHDIGGHLLPGEESFDPGQSLLQVLPQGRSNLQILALHS